MVYQIPSNYIIMITPITMPQFPETWPKNIFLRQPRKLARMLVLLISATFFIFFVHAIPSPPTHTCFSFQSTQLWVHTDMLLSVRRLRKQVLYRILLQPRWYILLRISLSVFLSSQGQTFWKMCRCRGRHFSNRSMCPFRCARCHAYYRDITYDCNKFLWKPRDLNILVFIKTL